MRRFFVFFISALILLCGAAQATNYYVDAVNGDNTNAGTAPGAGNAWKTITYASTTAASGDTINAAAGTYNAALGESFPISVPSSVHLKSVASPTTAATIDAESAVSRVVELGTSATLEGFTVKTSDATNWAVVAAASSDVVNNRIESGRYSLYLNGTNAEALTNTITSGASSYGIYIEETADGSTVRGNDIWAKSYGIWVDGNTSTAVAADNIMIDSNTIEAPTYGIRLNFVNNNWLITNNKIISPSSGTTYGIFNSSGVYNGTVSTNEVRGFTYGTYLAMASGKTVEIYNNTLVNNTYGVRHSGATANVKNNIITGAAQLGSFTTDTYGIYRVSGTVNSSYNDIWNVSFPYYSTVSGKTGDISSYPRFIDPNADDYSIGTDSPAATAGEGGTHMGKYAPSGTSSVVSESWVDDNGSDSNPGTEASPWKTLGKGLSNTDGTIHVKAGTYDAGNGDSFPLTLAEDQYLKSEAVPSTDAIIDGGGNNVIYLGPQTTVEGFTVKTSGSVGNWAVYALDTAYILNNTVTISATATKDLYGTYIGWYADDSLVQGNNIWVKNSQAGSSYDVHGVLINGWYTPTDDFAENVIVRANTIEVYADGQDTAGVWIRWKNSGYLVTDNVIKGSNVRRDFGIYNTNGVWTGTVSSNEVRGFTNGIWLAINGANTANIYDNTIVKNANYGIYCSGGTWNIKDNIIAAEVGGFSATGTTGIYRVSGTINSTYNDLYANDTNYYNSSAGTGSISQNPQFVAATNNDFHLNYNSPAIDAGDPGGTDPDGTRKDMGAYPFDLSVSGTMAVYVKTPNSGESLTGLTTTEISWYATKEGAAIDHIELYYSTDGGATFPNTISNSQPNDGSYIWTVANVDTTEARVRVVVVGSSATDESDGNFSISSVDATGPTVTVEAPAGGEQWQGGSGQNITFTVTDESGIKSNSLTIWYSTDNGTTYPNVITSEAAVSSPYSWTVPSISTSEVKVKVTVQDNSVNQNYGTNESAAKFTVDSTPPTTPTLVTPANASTTGDNTPELTWEAATDNLTGIASYEIKLDTTLITQGATTSYTPSPLAENLHTWEVKARDGAGNWGSYSAAFTFTVDTVGPNATGITLKDRITSSQTYTNDRVVSLEASGVSGNPTQMILSENANFSGAGWAAYQIQTTFEVSAGDGLKRVYYKIRDAGLNEAATVEATITLDTTSPTVTVTAPDGGEVITGGSTYNITWTASDAVGLKSNPIAIRYSTDSGSGWTLIASGEANDSSYAWSVPAINSTTCRVSLEAEDAAGNIGTDMSNSDFTIISAAPTVPHLISPTAESYVNTAKPTFQWQSVSGAVSYEIAIDTPTIIATLTATSYTPNVDLAEGSHSWQVRAKNIAEVWGDYSSSETFTVDLTPPSVSFNLIAGTKALMKMRAFVAAVGPEVNVPQPTFTGTAADNFEVAMVQIRIDGSSWNNATAADGNFNSASEPFNYQPNLQPGLHTMEGKALDAAGNWTADVNFDTVTFTFVSRGVSSEVRREGKPISSGDFIPPQPDFTVTITAGSFPITSLTIRLGSQQLFSTTGELTQLTKILTPASSLSPGAYTFRIEGKTSDGASFSQEITDLTVAKEEKVIVPTKTIVSRGSPTRPAVLNLELQASAGGKGILLVIDPVTQATLIEKHVPSINVGKNLISLDLVTNTGVTIPPGVLKWKLVYRGRVEAAGNVVVTRQ